MKLSSEGYDIQPVKYQWTINLNIRTPIYLPSLGADARLYTPYTTVRGRASMDQATSMDISLSPIIIPAIAQPPMRPHSLGLPVFSCPFLHIQSLRHGLTPISTDIAPHITINGQPALSHRFRNRRVARGKAPASAARGRIPRYLPLQPHHDVGRGSFPLLPLHNCTRRNIHGSSPPRAGRYAASQPQRPSGWQPHAEIHAPAELSRTARSESRMQAEGSLRRRRDGVNAAIRVHPIQMRRIRQRYSGHYNSHTNTLFSETPMSERGAPLHRFVVISTAPPRAVPEGRRWQQRPIDNNTPTTAPQRNNSTTQYPSTSHQPQPAPPNHPAVLTKTRLLPLPWSSPPSSLQNRARRGGERGLYTYTSPPSVPPPSGQTQPPSTPPPHPHLPTSPPPHPQPATGPKKRQRSFDASPPPPRHDPSLPVKKTPRCQERGQR